jgi:hypothetical protein
MFMVLHFQFKAMYEGKKLPGWTFSFYFQKQRFTGIYHPNGTIEWTGERPNEKDEVKLKEQIHELMLFHVYE